MRRVTYVEFLEQLRDQERERQSRPDPLEGVKLPRRRDTTKRLRVRLAPDQWVFLQEAVSATHARKIDESTVVTAGLVLLERLDIHWDSIASKRELVDAIRRRLRSLDQED